MKKKTKKKNITVALTAVTAAASSSVAYPTAKRSAAYNKECNEMREGLRLKVDAAQRSLNEKLAVDPNYKGDRAKAIALAYEYDKADISMGGNGSANLTASARSELMVKNKVRGYEGHHINSVGEHPSLQTNPNNIIFVKGRREHLEKHGGNFKNPTTGELINRDQMLIDTNNKRVRFNEQNGKRNALVIGGIGIGLMASYKVICECETDGCNLRSMWNGLKKSIKPAICITGISLAGYWATYTLTNKYI